MLQYSYRRQRLEVFCIKDVFKNVAKFAWKQLGRSLFFNKVTGLRLTQVFSREFCEIFKTGFSQKTSGRLFCLYFVFCNCLSKKLILKDVYLSDTLNNRGYKTITYSQARLGDKTGAIFTGCFALDNKIEWFQYITYFSMCGKICCFSFGLILEKTMSKEVDK